MPYLFWIDHAKARLKLVELVFLDTKWTQIYTLSDFEDFIFRYEDLSPWAVVLDEKQLPQANTLLHDFITKEKIKIIHLAEEKEILEFADKSVARISRLLNPMQLSANLRSIYLKTVGSDKLH